MEKRILGLLTAAVTILLFTACSKDDNITTQSYTVPATYEFDNVEYTEASGRVSMWAGLTNYLGRSTTRRLSADTATFLWNNTNAAFTAETSNNLPFSAAQLNSSGFNLAGKTADAPEFKKLIDSMVIISQYYNATASSGVPGKIGTRVFNHSGLEFNQAVAKGLMGAVVLNQVLTHLDKTVSDDNNTVIAGQGTAMQHDWDLAFGYVGIAKDYDTATLYAGSDPKRPLALGGYFGERGRYIKAGGTIFEAFRKGRAAIVARDYAARDQAIATIKEFMEKTIAAAAYDYVTIPQSNNDLAAKFHALSEGYGFVLALKYRPANSKLSAANYQTLQNILKTNFYELAADASNTKLKNAQSILTGAYGQLQAN